MKRINCLLLICTLLFNCKKSEINHSETISPGLSTTDCHFDSDIKQNPNVIGLDMQEQYLNIWKSVMQTQNNMSEKYFKEHIISPKISSSEWNAGVSVRIDYVVNHNWIKVKVYDEFIIKLNNNYSYYPDLKLVKNQYLNQSQILNNVINKVESRFTKINSLAGLKFNSCTETLNFVKNKTIYKNAQLDYPCFEIPIKDKTKLGDPYLMLTGNIDTNKCLNGYINLNSGEITTFENACTQN